MPHHHVQHMRNVGPNLLAHNENIAYVMPRGTAHAVISCVHHAVCMQASQPPYVYVAHQELLMDMPFAQAEQYLSKITGSHFSTLNMKFANQNKLKRILIAMLNKNKADWNKNFRICEEEPVAPLYKR